MKKELEKKKIGSAGLKKKGQGVSGILSFFREIMLKFFTHTLPAQWPLVPFQLVLELLRLMHL